MPGETFSHYQVREKIGHGGMGEVHLAHDTSLDRRVALKFLPESLQHNETAKRRFLREAKSAAALDHPYICKIYEIGEAEGKSFIAMEYVRGQTLEQKLAKGTLPLDQTIRITSEIAEALETAHQEGIVHRDLKPSNIMLTEGGHAKVMDFGLAKRVASAEGVDSQFETTPQLTDKGSTLGTLAYMSPEQLRGESVDTRSDIFSFGLVFYEMLAGTHPFSKATTMDTTAGILNQEPEPISRYRQDVPEHLVLIVQKMLAKGSGERYQLVHDVRTDLGRVRQKAVPERARRLQLGLGGVAALALLVATVWWSASTWAPTSDPQVTSVAVLPLENLSEDALETDYLAEGISRAVITKLVQAGLRVTPWETVRRFAHSGDPPEKIAKELNVNNVLVGTFELVDDRIVTTLSLMESDGLLSWADEFEEPYEDIFRVQRRIAVGAARSLKKKLTGEEEKALDEPESHSVEAYDFYLQGAHILQEGGQEATNIAFEYFTRAAELDPNLADAFVGLGAVHTDRYLYGWGGLSSLTQAEASYKRAIQLNQASMRAHRGLTYVNFLSGRTEAQLIQAREAARLGRPDDVETLLTRARGYLLGPMGERASSLYRRAIELDPVNAEAHAYLTINTWATEPERTVEAGKEFFRLFGDYHEVHNYVAYSYQLLGNHERAREHYEKAIKSSPSGDPNLESLLFRGILMDQLGDRAQAEKAWWAGVESVTAKLEAYPDNAGMRLLLACFYGLLGEQASSLAEEERALASNVSGYAWYYLAAVRARLGDTERAIELLRRVVRRGRIEPLWEPFLRRAFAPPMRSEAFDQFVKEYEAEAQRLREKY